MFRKSMIVLLLIALVAGGGALYGMQAQEDATTLDAATQPAASSGDDGTSQDGGLTVYVTGAVNQPGVVTVATGARVADAVNACGGLSPEADGEAINMAQAVKDGQQIRVPAKGAQNAAANGGNNTASAKAGGSANSADTGGLVNINTADEKALDTLPGVGPATAQKIIEYRENEGAFQSPEDIMKVRGIGKAKYEKMKDKITI
ncbi:MAG: helix-hairpin-helix domain-containing protein [Veillonellaceae bacterium]|nr:helix-hairpin-helix domain-containing protein [Veillonellaceae bacterium]